MNKKIHFSILTLAIFIFIACGEKRNDEAIQYLSDIYSNYENGEYEKALSMIDSFQTLHPKAFKEIKEGLSFKQDVRRALNLQQITYCDSLISVYQPKIDSIKQLFVLQKDKEYQQRGIYIPKSVNTNTLSGTMLRAGVYEDGALYIESVYLGGQLHEKIKVSTKDNQFAESLPVTDDGLNFRFTHAGQQYEVIKVMPNHDNGLANFIYSYSKQPLTVTLDGKNKMSFTLSNSQKKAITDSYQLSTWILQKDSLLSERGKAETLIKYLDSKQEEVATTNPE